jgi:hypothetical protein
MIIRGHSGKDSIEVTIANQPDVAFNPEDTVICPGENLVISLNPMAGDYDGVMDQMMQPIRFHLQEPIPLHWMMDVIFRKMKLKLSPGSSCTFLAW